MTKFTKKDFRSIALDFEKKGDENKAIAYLLKAIEAGDALACIDMVLEIKYLREGYEYSKEALAAIDPEKFGYYLDLGIELGSLDCMFYKAREQVIGDGFIDYNAKEAYETFLKLKELGYDPRFFDEDVSALDDYINSALKDMNRSFNKPKYTQRYVRL